LIRPVCNVAATYLFAVFLGVLIRLLPAVTHGLAVRLVNCKNTPMVPLFRIGDAQRESSGILCPLAS
jgi:hypothetical protein